MCIYVDLLLKVVTWTITAEGGVNVTQVFSKHAVCCDWLSADQDSESVFQSLNFQTGNYEDSDPGRICCVESEAEVRHSSILWPENSRTALLYLCKPGSGFCFQLCRLNFEGNPELACRKQVRLKPTTFPDENPGPSDASRSDSKLSLCTLKSPDKISDTDERPLWDWFLGFRWLWPALSCT